MSGQLTKDLLLRVFDRLNEKLREADEHGAMSTRTSAADTARSRKPSPSDTRAEALRIHERTYGDEPMTEEADQYLIDRYRPRPVGPNETAGRPQTGEASKGKGWTR